MGVICVEMRLTPADGFFSSKPPCRVGGLIRCLGSRIPLLGNCLETVNPRLGYFKVLRLYHSIDLHGPSDSDSVFLENHFILNTCNYDNIYNVDGSVYQVLTLFNIKFYLPKNFSISQNIAIRIHCASRNGVFTMFRVTA